ncbi:MAG: PepT transporter family, permease [Dehalococcoidia bacterium]|nr:PepT transporter family, permease [Dehalococcoidia bacterium]
MVLVMSLTAVAAPILAPEDPTRQNYDAVLAPLSLDHPLGTDRLGRDTLSRLMHGARTSLAVGVLTQLIVVAIGIPVGVIAGFTTPHGGNLIMRAVDVVYALPDLLFIILLRAIFGGNLFMMIMAIGLVSWPTVARLVRGQTLSLKEREFILAAREIGASEPRIILHHLLPNSLGPVIVAVTFLVPRAIFAEAALSYIGIGVMSPTPSWGSMVQEGYSVIFVSYEQVLFPTIAIAMVMMAFTFLGDGLRDLLDPRSG